MSSFEGLINETKDMVKNVLNQKSNRPYYISDHQLYFILKELDTMMVTKKTKNFHPYYPRGIADSWDPQDPLAIKLLEVLDVYSNL